MEDPRSSPHVRHLLDKKAEREDWTFGDMLDRGAEMESLKEHPGWRLLMELIEETRDDFVTNLEATPVAQPQSIANQLGRRTGLGLVAEATQSVLAKAEWARAELERGTAEMAEAEG